MHVLLDFINKEGRTFRSIRPNSFVGGWVDLLYRHFVFHNNGGLTVRNEFDARADGGDTTRGVLVGTGTTGVAVTDTGLDQLIEDGNGSGELLYGQMAVSLLDVDGFRVISLDRTYENATGAEIVIREVGLKLRYDPTNNANESLLVERTVLATPIPVEDSGGTVTVRYRIMA